MLYICEIPKNIVFAFIFMGTLMKYLYFNAHGWKIPTMIQFVRTPNTTWSVCSHNMVSLNLSLTSIVFRHGAHILQKWNYNILIYVLNVCLAKYGSHCDFVVFDILWQFIMNYYKTLCWTMSCAQSAGWGHTEYYKISHSYIPVWSGLTRLTD